MDQPLPPTQLAAMDLAGRLFLHEQGAFVGRGRVSDLAIDSNRWELAVREVERLDPVTRLWSPDCDTDTYCGDIRDAHTFQFDPSTGLITISGYGLVVYIAPADAQWADVDWPETDLSP